MNTVVTCPLRDDVPPPMWAECLNEGTIPHICLQLRDGICSRADALRKEIKEHENSNNPGTDSPTEGVF
jgi:hypothetical protein